MHRSEESAWSGFDILAEVEVAVAPQTGELRPVCPFGVTVGDTYLPAFFRDGILYVQAPLRHVVEAVGEALSRRVCHLEVGISRPGCPTLPLDSDGRPLHGTSVAFEDLVRGGWKW